MIDRRAAEQLDAEDPLAHWHDEFVVDDPELIYLDGNSLGRTPQPNGRRPPPGGRGAVGRRSHRVLARP